MTTQEHRVLETALTTLHQTTGLGARVLPAIAGQNGVGDAIIEVETDRRKYRFAAEVKKMTNKLLRDVSKDGKTLNMEAVNALIKIGAPAVAPFHLGEKVLT